MALRLKDITGENMKVEDKLPPNFADILKVFPTAQKPGVLFAYGDTIFNPSGILIPMSLLAHECTHAMQQRTIGVDLWWDSYLRFPTFRFNQELEAHIVEAESACEGEGRVVRRRYLAAIAERLSGELYGRMTTKAKALAEIKQALK